MSAPLDRTTAISYGKFVNTVYQMFDLNPGNLTPPLPPPSDPDALPSGWELAAWVQMSDFAVTGRRDPTFYGIIARNVADPYSLILAIRGTEGLIEWFDDVVCFPKPFAPVPKAGDVSMGFDDIYSTMRVVRCTSPGAADAKNATPEPMLAQTLADQIEELLTKLPAPAEGPSALHEAGKYDLVVTGHSLGAALATLYTMEHAMKKKADPTRAIVLDRVCTFGSPRVGMEAFVRTFDTLPIDSWRIVNQQDLVPKLPPSIPLLLPYQHVDTAYTFDSTGIVKPNLGCWHHMTTYLHLLNADQPLDAACAVASNNGAAQASTPTASAATPAPPPTPAAAPVANGTLAAKA